MNKDRLVDLLVGGKPAGKVNKVFSFHPVHDKCRPTKCTSGKLMYFFKNVFYVFIVPNPGAPLLEDGSNKYS